METREDMLLPNWKDCLFGDFILQLLGLTREIHYCSNYYYKEFNYLNQFKNVAITVKEHSRI